MYGASGNVSTIRQIIPSASIEFFISLSSPKQGSAICYGALFSYAFTVTIIIRLTQVSVLAARIGESNWCIHGDVLTLELPPFNPGLGFSAYLLVITICSVV